MAIILGQSKLLQLLPLTIPQRKIIWVWVVLSGCYSCVDIPCHSWHVERYPTPPLIVFMPGFPVKPRPRPCLEKRGRFNSSGSSSFSLLKWQFFRGYPDIPYFQTNPMRDPKNWAEEPSEAAQRCHVLVDSGSTSPSSEPIRKRSTRVNNSK